MTILVKTLRSEGSLGTPWFILNFFLLGFTWSASLLLYCHSTDVHSVWMFSPPLSPFFSFLCPADVDALHGSILSLLSPGYGGAENLQAQLHLVSEPFLGVQRGIRKLHWQEPVGPWISLALLGQMLRMRYGESWLSTSALSLSCPRVRPVCPVCATSLDPSLWMELGCLPRLASLGKLDFAFQLLGQWQEICSETANLSAGHGCCSADRPDQTSQIPALVWFSLNLLRPSERVSGTAGSLL